MLPSARSKISVIIPTYNYGRFLREALNSVFRQELSDIEVIVVDDESTDETSKILAGISDARVRVFRVPHGGISSARNKGLKEATGAYVAFLDADDRWRPGILKAGRDVLESDPAVGAVFTDFIRFNEEGFLANQFTFFPELLSMCTRPTQRGRGRIVMGDSFLQMISMRQFPAYLQSMMFRQSVIKDLHFPSGEKISEDLYFAMRVYERTNVAFIPEVLLEVRRHGNNSYSSALEKTFWDLRALRLLEAQCSTEPHKAAVRTRIGRLLAGLGYGYFWNKQVWAAARSYLSCLKYPGSRLTSMLHLMALPISPLLMARGSEVQPKNPDLGRER